MKKRLLYHIRSFGYAISGLKALLLGERNMLVHLLATLAVIAMGLWYRLSTERWCLLLFAIAGVWIAEAFNTALERLCNVVSPERHPVIKQVKDISAAAVLLAAIAAVLAGIGVFFF
jgi:diacylglycerol kinase (ATP)